MIRAFRSVGRRVQRGASALLQRARAVLRRYLPNESQHLFGLTIVVGLISGVVAVAFHLAIQATEHLLIDRALNAKGHQWIAWTIVSPTVGGLVLEHY